MSYVNKVTVIVLGFTALAMVVAVAAVALDYPLLMFVVFVCLMAPVVWPEPKGVL